jgi:hypothetical protein
MTDSSERRDAGITFFKEDDAVINRVISRGLTFGVRLKVTQVMRLLLTVVDPEKVPEEAFLAARRQRSILRRQKLTKAPRK